MPNEEPVRQSIDVALNQFESLDPHLRDSALRAIFAHIQYVHATMTGGAGPVAVPPAPAGASPTTQGTFKCPKCNYNGAASYT